VVIRHIAYVKVTGDAVIHPTTPAGFGRRAIQSGTEEVVIAIDDVVQLTESFNLLFLSLPKDGIADIHMHSTGCFVGISLDSESREILVKHNLPCSVIIADAGFGHNLSNDLRAGISTEAAIILHLKHVRPKLELREDDLFKAFSQHGLIHRASALNLNLTAKAVERLPIRSHKKAIDESRLFLPVTVEVPVASES
jgi:hypothetical protein